MSTARMRIVCYDPMKNVYKLKQNDQLIFVFDKYKQPPFWELNIENASEVIRRTDLVEDTTFRKKTGSGTQRVVSIYEFELPGIHEFKVTHQDLGTNDKYIHVIQIIIERSESKKKSGCVIL
jgi:hypothetical protein